MPVAEAGGVAGDTAAMAEDMGPTVEDMGGTEDTEVTEARTITRCGDTSRKAFARIRGASWSARNCVKIKKAGARAVDLRQRQLRRIVEWS